MYINVDIAVQCRMPIINVYLDGVHIQHVVEADDEDGFVTIYRRDLWEKKMEQIPTQRLYGKVKICIGDYYGR